ncbi:MAG: rod shape-determining protein MreD [Spirochaetaceae bacterium]|nr:rod shape-determining protein MreD [Spirochaetaceae bacterium]
MVKNIIWAVVFIIIAGILQSTLIARLAFFFRVKTIPDIALCILVFSAYQNGMMTGQVTGFVSGLFLDFLSQSPLGLNIFVRTVIGALTGVIRGNLILDAVFLPIGLCAAATLLKAVLLFFLHFLFAGAVNAYEWSGPALWIELALNAALAPFLFDFLKKFGILLERKREV